MWGSGLHVKCSWCNRIFRVINKPRQCLLILQMTCVIVQDFSVQSELLSRGVEVLQLVDTPVRQQGFSCNPFWLEKACQASAWKLSVTRPKETLQAKPGRACLLKGTMGGLMTRSLVQAAKNSHSHLNCETHFYGRNGKGSDRFEVHMLYILSVLLYIFNMLRGQSFFRSIWESYSCCTLLYCLVVSE